MNILQFSGPPKTERTRACVRALYSSVNTLNGKVIGGVTANVIPYAYTSHNDTTWGFQVELRTTSAFGTGVGAAIEGIPHCSGTACNIKNARAMRGPAAVGKVISGDTFWQWTAGAIGSIGTGAANWGITTTFPGTRTPIRYIDTPMVRCDHAVPGYVPGCVIPSATPIVVFAFSSYPEFSWHMIRAIQSGLPYTLHRTTDDARIKANRKAACPPNRVPANTKSCDEYPFASTLEGAGSGGPARTQLNCGIPDLPSTSKGPIGFSVCMIDDAQNKLAGAALNSLGYQKNRIINADAFMVSGSF